MIKTQYLTFAGILSAIILTGMFTAIIFTTISPSLFFPLTTIDPITENSLDSHNRLILTGTTTTAGVNALIIKILNRSDDRMQDTASLPYVAKGFAGLLSDTDTRNPWKGYVDISSLEPGDYRGILVSRTYSENGTNIIESDPLATFHFTLGDAQASPGILQKKIVHDEPFIRINPSRENMSPAEWQITGITSLTPGSRISWLLNKTRQDPGRGNSSLSGETDVTEGMDGINRWSVVPDSSFWEPGDYRLSTTGRAPGLGVGSPDANAPSATAEFTLPSTGTTGSDRVKEYITIDALPAMQADGVYLISGTTSLHGGEELFVDVTPDFSGKGFDLIIDPKDGSQKTGLFSGTAGMTRVSQVTRGPGLWTFEIETYLLNPRLYRVSVSAGGFDPTAPDFGHGSLSVSRTFTIMEKTS